MDLGMFFNRQRELRFLNTQCSGDSAALVVLYGRRRTGKTSLLRHFARDRRTVFYVADTASRSDQLAAFSRAVFQGVGEAALAETRFPDWETALRFVASRAVDDPLLVVMDEFSYLCDSDRSLPSVIQRLWDAELRHSHLHIVLCGSYVSFMERDLLGSKNPLHGRRTGTWRLDPFEFAEARLFFPDQPIDEQLGLYGVFGGIPAYLERLNPRRTLGRNIIEAILTRGAPLYDEPRFLLMQELRDPHTYFSICKAVAMGRTTPNEIAQGAGLSDRGVASRYLQTLRDLHVLERRVPTTERNPERTRRGRYYLQDPYLRFWFRFVLPNLSALESGTPDQVHHSRIAPWLDQHLARSFEEVCLQHLRTLATQGALPATYDRIGGWWRGREEVDLIAVSDDGALLMGECKWSRKPVGVDVLEGLEAKIPKVAADMKRAPRSVRLALFSRAGFTQAARLRADAEGVLLFGLTDLE
jgi:uncharacterized protein